jgi:hypothetical protein
VKLPVREAEDCVDRHFEVGMLAVSTDQKRQSTGAPASGPERPTIPVKCERAEATGIGSVPRTS